MPNHFSSIGIPIHSQDELLELAEQAADEAETIETSAGCYLRWASPSGAELWLQLDADNEMVGLNPHFSGESRVRVGLTARVSRPEATELDSAFHGWADPRDGDPENGSYPFVFDSPDARCHNNLELPAIVEAQIAAFAQETNVFESEAAYAASQTGEVKFASQSFIPSGLFTPGDGKAEPPEALAIFTGHILKAELRTNELTGGNFWWVLVESLGGVFDVVIDPELLAVPPRVGGVLSGSFWLSGRLRRAK